VSPTLRPVVVVGATGQQGGAVVDALLERGQAVRAAVRDTRGGKAAALAARGVDVIAADLDSAESMRNLFAGAAAGFAMTTFSGPTGVRGEVGHGRVLASAARDAGLPFMVYSSVGGAERNSGVPHFESKNQIEQLLRRAVPTAFVRPTFFMENLPFMLHRADAGAVLSIPLSGDVPLQMVSVKTIGEVATAMLLDPPPGGTALEIADDELTGTQMAGQLTAHLGVPVAYVEAPLTALAGDDDMIAMYRWLAQVPSYQADLVRTSQLAPAAGPFPQWLARRGRF
jgi:uncharacterized protein YbjT (DUF2867 family)